MLESEKVLATALLAPGMLILVLFIAYPFVMAIWFSLTSIRVGDPGQFVGLDNFTKAWSDTIFQVAFKNTVVLHVLGHHLQTGARHVARSAAEPQLPLQADHPRLDAAAVHHPDRALGIRLALDVRSDIQRHELDAVPRGLITDRLPFLSDGDWAMWCAVLVNTWRGMPFFAITLLAGLQTISPDLHEAAALDGANAWDRFWHVTWPLLMPVTLVVVVFSVIQTSRISSSSTCSPAAARRTPPTWSPPTPTRSASPSGLLGEGAALSLFMFPVLFAVVWSSCAS